MVYFPPPKNYGVNRKIGDPHGSCGNPLFDLSSVSEPNHSIRFTLRLKAKTDGSKCLTYTGLLGELEHLKIETRLIDEIFECVMGEDKNLLRCILL